MMLPPTINIPTEDGTILTLIYSYDFSVTQAVMWYVEVNYSSETVGNINKIESFMKDVDPETSRGYINSTSINHNMKLKIFFLFSFFY
jgi:hypothetical protein